MFEDKHIMSMTNEELQEEIEKTKKSVEHEERLKILKQKVIWIGLGLIALIAILR